MVEVRPPHESAHGWRDFFVHIATIVVGLILAFGLEQGLEAVHRHRVRQELERNLRREAQENMDRLELGRHTWAESAKWASDCVSILRGATAGRGVITVTLPELAKPGGSSSPVQSVWTVAKSNGTLSLLPEGDAEVFGHIAHDADQEEVVFAEAEKQRTAEQTLETQFGIKVEPGATLRLWEIQRDALIAVLASVATADKNEAEWLAACEGANAALLAGAQTREAMNPYIEGYVRDTTQ